MSIDARAFLLGLAEECERDGIPYSKGRSRGIRETLTDCDGIIDRLTAQLAACRAECRAWRQRFCKPFDQTWKYPEIEVAATDAGNIADAILLARFALLRERAAQIGRAA